MVVLRNEVFIWILTFHVISKLWSIIIAKDFSMKNTIQRQFFFRKVCQSSIGIQISNWLAGYSSWYWKIIQSIMLIIHLIENHNQHEFFLELVVTKNCYRNIPWCHFNTLTTCTLKQIKWCFTRCGSRLWLLQNCDKNINFQFPDAFVS